MMNWTVVTIVDTIILPISIITSHHWKVNYYYRIIYLRYFDKYVNLSIITKAIIKQIILLPHL